MNLFRRVSIVVIVCAAVIALLAVSRRPAQAAFTTDFDPLLTELESRALAVSNSTDKAEQKLFKTLTKAITAINKPADDLGDDIKTAGKLAKSLEKTFPGDTNLNAIGTVVFSNLEADVQVELDDLQTLISGLPDGKAKDKAQAALDAAQDAIDSADAAGDDFPTVAKELGSALKSALKGQAAANSGGGGGGGGTNNVLTATIVINGSNYNWIGFAGGITEFAPTSVPQLDIAGADGTYSVNSTLCSNFTGAAGDYALGGGCPCGVVTLSNVTFFAAVSGTLHIDAFDTNTTSLSGTFAYSASDGITTIVVTNGQFDLHNMQISP